MVFSAEKWDNGRELQDVIKGSAAMDWVVFGPVLRDGFNLFIRPLFGDAMAIRLSRAYMNPNPCDLDRELVSLAQRANANLALWYSFNELNSVLSSSGTQRIESEGFKTLYKYQERTLRDGYKTKGFNALDDLIVFLEKHQELYPAFLHSRAYLQQYMTLVPSAEVIDQYIPIECSRLVYLRFLPEMRFIEITRITSDIGETLYKKLLERELSDPKYTELKSLLQPVVICLAAARLIRNGGNITDRGLYFTSIVGGVSGNDETQSPANLTVAAKRAKQLEDDAREYMNLANRYIKKEFPDQHAGSPSSAFDFDNNDRKIFIT